MDQSVGNTDPTSTVATTFENFATKTTASVVDVLKKARSFGFREVDIHFGSKKIPPDEGTDEAIHFLDGKPFCFAALTDNTVNSRTSGLVKRFFPPPILKKLCQDDKVRLEAAYHMIEKAFKYHDFIEENAGEFRPGKETLSSFLRRKNEKEHFSFLQNIALGMKDGPEITTHRNGYYLLALWVELSNAMSPDFQRKDLFNWRDFAVAKSRPDRNKRKPLPEVLLPRPRKKLKVEGKIDASRSPGKTINFTLSSSGNNQQTTADGAAYSNTDEATVDDLDKVTCDNTGSQSAEDNFVEKAEREGKSDREITIQKVNHLAQQVINNLGLLQQDQARTRQPTVSASQKRQIILTLHEGLTLINGLKATKK